MSTFNIDFIGVGGEKTASTWISKCLAEHPQICFSYEKEIEFFDTTPLMGEPPKIPSRYEKEGIEPYKKYFNQCSDDTIKGEFSVTYLHDKKVAPLLAEIFPRVKILISLRNPVDRTYSMYNGLKNKMGYTCFEQAIEIEPELIRRSLYAEYVALYLQHFPKEQILIVLYEDMINDKLKFIQHIFQFLNIDDTFIPPTLNLRERSAQEKTVMQFRQKLGRIRGAELIMTGIRKLGLSARLKKMAITLTPKESMNPQTKERLREIFANDIARTSEILGRDLTKIWK